MPAFAQQLVDKFVAPAVIVSMVIYVIMPGLTRSLASRLIRALQEPVHGRDVTSDVMIALIVCGIFFSLAALLFVTRTLLGDNEETREIKARLRFYQVEPRQFSDQCLMELVEVATRDLRSSEYPMNREVHVAIDQAAIEVRNILSGHKYYTSEEIAQDAAHGSANPYWQKLAFFDPRRFSLDRLAQTQARYGGRSGD